LVPPQEPVHVQVKVVALVVTDEAVPELHKFVVGAVHEESVSAEPQEALITDLVAEHDTLLPAVRQVADDCPLQVQLKVPSVPLLSVTVDP